MKAVFHAISSKTGIGRIWKSQVLLYFYSVTFIRQGKKKHSFLGIAWGQLFFRGHHFCYSASLIGMVTSLLRCNDTKILAPFIYT